LSHMPIVTVENIHHSYGARVALDGVSFDVASGECFGILGPNGSGKSTLFKILTTLLPPTSGRAAVAGFDVAKQPGSVRGSIGVVFQSPSLDIHLTVGENLTHGGRLYGLGGMQLRQRMEQVSAALGIEDRLKSRVKTLSGGLKRRAELAKCLLHRPSVMLLDEPSTGLDPLARKELGRQLDALRREHGITVLLTTHDMDEADRCDRLAIFDQGKLVAIGAPEELKRRIGGETVIIDAPDADGVTAEIETALRVKVGRADGLMRIETADGAALLSRLLPRFGSRIRSLTLGKPTLEDVFVRETGHRFESRSAPERAA